MLKEAVREASLFAFWRQDIPRLQELHGLRTEEAVLRLLARRYLLMPMESSSVGFLWEFDFECVLPDLLLPPEANSTCFSEACRLFYYWRKRSAWPDVLSLLWKSLHYQFLSLFTARMLAESWIRGGVASVTCLQQADLKAGPYWSDTDIPKAVWMDVLGERYEPVHYKMPAPAVLARIKAKAGIAKRWLQANRPAFTLSGTRSAPQATVDYNPLEESIAVFIQGIYAQRDSFWIRQLQETGKNVCVIAFGLGAEEIAAASKLLGLPVFALEGREPVMDLPTLEALEDELTGLLGTLSLAAKLICASARDLHAQRSREHAWLKQLFSSHRPKVCFVSEVSDVIARYCESACAELEIPVINMPHGVAQDPRIYDVLSNPKRVSLTSAKLYEEAYATDAVSSRVTSIEGLFSADEYTMARIAAVNEDKPFVLFVFGDTQSAPSLAYKDGPSARVRLATALRSPPSHLAAKFNYALKLHPVLHDRAILDMAQVPSDVILPLDSNLEALLEKTAVLVSCNYVSSPTHQALLKGIPAIHLNTAGKFTTCIDACYNRQGILYAFSVEQMWEYVEGLLADGSFKASVLRRQKKIFAESLVPSLSLTLPQFAERVISNPDWISSIPLRSLQPGFWPEDVVDDVGVAMR